MSTGANGNTPLKWDVFVAKRQGLTRDLPPGKEELMWVPGSATLIYGEKDAVLVDTLLTVEQAKALVEWVAAHGKNVTTIYVTHGHGDHFFGLGAVLDRFPKARAVAMPEVVKVMRRQAAPETVTSFWKARYPGQIPERLVIAEELKGNVIHLEGRELIGVPLGHTDTDNTTCLHVPSVGLVVAGMRLTTTFTFTSRSQTCKRGVTGLPLWIRSKRSNRERLSPDTRKLRGTTIRESLKRRASTSGISTA